jgi:hypothetical protein
VSPAGKFLDAFMRPKHWTHERTHFFKFVTFETARSVLSNGSLRWSAATRFNDPFDGQFNLQMEYDVDRVAQTVLERHWAVLSGSRKSIEKNALGALLNFAAGRLPSKMSKEDFFRQMLLAVLKGIGRGEEQLPIVQEQIKTVLADFKFLCLAERPDSILMWSHYAQHHTGAVLAFVCVPERDSLWGAAQPVQYPRYMPRLMTEQQFTDHLSGDFSLKTTITLQNMIFTKAEEWSYEKEWRVALPGTNPADHWQDIKFHPLELAGIYLGCNMSQAAKTELVGLMQARYAHGEIIVARKSPTAFALDFDPSPTWPFEGRLPLPT